MWGAACAIYFVVATLEFKGLSLFKETRALMSKPHALVHHLPHGDFGRLDHDKVNDASDCYDGPGDGGQRYHFEEGIEACMHKAGAK